eukprot:TRINITY_DN2294_c0_g1_i1.p1 TRINITY_DN2294_c0_g1~~TRINITY_DN2294_c0_g1_i1.p1  ORF type:complete len:127 (-),score=31.42 TRINITY_DN2294_c0_g1_i1:19-399(-)
MCIRDSYNLVTFKVFYDFCSYLSSVYSRGANGNIVSVTNKKYIVKRHFFSFFNWQTINKNLLVFRNFYLLPCYLYNCVHSESFINCLLYTSDAADDLLCVDLGGRRIIKKKKKAALEACNDSKKKI